MRLLLWCFLLTAFQPGTTRLGLTAEAHAALCPKRIRGNSAKFISSEESGSKPQQQQQELQQCSGTSAVPIHLSIRATSQAKNGPGNIQEQENILYHARHSVDTSRYMFRGWIGGENRCMTGLSPSQPCLNLYSLVAD